MNGHSASNKGDYDLHRLSVFISKLGGSIDNDRRGSQAGGMTMTSEFASSTDGPKTDATKGSSGSINIDLIMVAASVFNLPIKAVGVSVGELPEWAAMSRDIGEAYNGLEEKYRKEEAEKNAPPTTQYKPVEKATPTNPAKMPGLNPMFKKPGNVVYRRGSGLKTEVEDTTGRAHITDKQATDTFPPIQRH